MMIKRLSELRVVVSLASVFVCFFTLPPTSQPQKKTVPSQPKVYDDLDGYKVLSLLLEEESKVWQDAVVQIHYRTASKMHSLDECARVPKDFEPAAQDFEKKAEERQTLQKKFTLRTPYALVRGRKGDSADAVKPPSERRGTYFVSAVGFNETRTHAIAYVDHICGFLCGGGSFHFLVKGKEGWQKAEGIPVCGWVY